MAKDGAPRIRVTVFDVRERDPVGQVRRLKLASAPAGRAAAQNPRRPGEGVRQILRDSARELRRRCAAPVRLDGRRQRDTDADEIDDQDQSNQSAHSFARFRFRFRATPDNT